MNSIKTIQNGEVKNSSVRPKSLTPAVLGMPNSHGVKLSLNMTSEDKRDLMTKLAEWKKARKEKLVARILTKQKQIESSKEASAGITIKSKQAPLKDNKSPTVQGRSQSVFERLYYNNTSSKGKLKKFEVGHHSNKHVSVLQNLKKSVSMPLENSNKAFQIEKSDCGSLQMNAESTEAKEQESVLQVEDSTNSCDTMTADKAAMVELNDNVYDSMEFVKENSTEAVGPSKTSVLVFGSAHEKINMIPESKETSLASQSIPVKFPSKAVKIERPKNPLRKSISMMFRQKSKADYKIRKSFSARNLNELSVNEKKTRFTEGIVLPAPSYGNENEKKIEGSERTVSFVTPKCNNKLSLKTSTNLRNKLENWLKLNGHSLEKYRHLRCFGITNDTKSFPLVSATQLDNSCYDTSVNTPVDDSNKENLTPHSVVQHDDSKDVENWLKELHRLIVELKYPSERCEEWLAAIRKKCNSCTTLPIYWECLAALHESKGDIKSAIEDYERVIIKGGEVNAVGDSLAELFEKMVIEQKKGSKPKLEKGLDPKNIFRSTIIKFALQQKALKKLSSEMDPDVREQLYIATPVRRSTRIQTPYKADGEVVSLRTLTPELRKNVIFKPNESLLNGE